MTRHVALAGCVVREIAMRRATPDSRAPRVGSEIPMTTNDHADEKRTGTEPPQDGTATWRQHRERVLEKHGLLEVGA